MIRGDAGWLANGAVVFLALLWVQFFATLSASWSGSQYYEYGWFVPPLVFGLAIRNLRHRPVGDRDIRPAIPLVPLLLGSLPLLFLLRIVEQFDPAWRIPLWLHGFLLLGLGYPILVRRFGYERTRSLAGVGLLALTAIPLPSFLEARAILLLTDQVMNLGVFLCWWIGIPVSAQGHYLFLEGNVVEVAEGCSGIRSLQTMLMWVLLLGELFRLPGLSRLLLVAGGFAMAFAANVGRAVALAWLVFDHEKGVFDEWHDTVGHIAFVLSAGLTLVLAIAMDRLRPSGAPRPTRASPLFHSRRETR